jgi:hypothetical protein
MKTLELEILRKFFAKTYTIGKFSVDNIYKCDTCEDPVRELQDINHDGDFDEEGEGKIYGKTAIPCGRHRVIVTYSPKLGRRLPLIVDVLGFTGIRIHGGKNADWSEGCPLVGENKIKGGLINYKYWETYIVKLIDEATAEGKKTWITIKQ